MVHRKAALVGVFGAMICASTVALSNPPREREMIVDLAAKDATSRRAIRVSAEADPKKPDVVLAKVTISKDKKVDQTLSFPVQINAETVAATAELIDLNFDGYLDFVVLRERGAKWGRYEVFSYDKKAAKFVKDGFAKQLSKLDNLEVDGFNKELVSTSVGPIDPSRTVHKVQNGTLVVVESCTFENRDDTDQDDRTEGLLVQKRTEKGVLKTIKRAQVSFPLGTNPCAV